MNINRPRNTKQKGMIEFLFYKEKDNFVGVCLTFDIIEVGTNMFELQKILIESAQLHLKTVVDKKLPEDLLNRYAPKKYWKKYFDSQKENGFKSVQKSSVLVRSPYQNSTVQFA